MDKYGAVVEGVENDWVVNHERLMKKMNSALERGDRDRESQRADAKDESSEPLSEVAGSGSAETKNLESRELGLRAS